MWRIIFNRRMFPPSTANEPLDRKAWKAPSSSPLQCIGEFLFSKDSKYWIYE